MPTLKDDKPEPHEPGHRPGHEEQQLIDTSKGYEQTDVKSTGILVFLTAMGIFVAVVGFVSFGLGRMINRQMATDDGPRSKWATTADVRSLGDMASNPEMQKKVAEMTQGFPTPKVQTDDGLQDMVDLHAKEDLLLYHYSWVNQAQGKVRIPIDRAMELIAARGLPVAARVDHAPLMTGDAEPTVTVPLTNGFVRTGFEQEQAAAVRMHEERKK
jgi:hypothetical protein